jgi:hypothetical protein
LEDIHHHCTLPSHHITFVAGNWWCTKPGLPRYDLLRYLLANLCDLSQRGVHLLRHLWLVPAVLRIALHLLDVQLSSASFLVCEDVLSMWGQAKATFLECSVGCHVRILLVGLLHAGRSNDDFPLAMPLLRLVPTVVEEKATGEG